MVPNQEVPHTTVLEGTNEVCDSEPSLPVRIPGSGLEATNALGAAYTLCGLALTAGGLVLASASATGLWILGQVLLGLAFLQWFSLLHEAGHGILFRTRRWNLLAGGMAGFFSLIPFRSWCIVHASHHRWTGWKDLDSSSAILATRERGPLELGLWNVAWRTGLPLFSLVYRWSNFWNPGRFERFHPGQGRAAAARAAGHLLIHGALVAWVGPRELAVLVGPGLLLGLALQDLILLSQHTHIPTPSSGGMPVSPLSGRDQASFTRSIALPRWLGVGLLCGIGEHELHHAYPQVPGYRLHRVPATPARRLPALTFLREAKRLRGEDFLFGDATARSRTPG